ncbi:MAG: class I SAM-dependent methyltransferase [Thermoleophilia bacterium]
METRTDILELPSDLYSRNIIISEGIKKFKKDRGLERIRVLDLGGRNGKLSLFLDAEDELALLDRREGDEENLIAGDATNMQFGDDSFDVVTSGDVFEHIPPDRRDRFIREALRVSSGLVIVAAPFADGQNEYAERVVNGYYKRLTGTDHEWLAEHIENGLPSAGDLESFFRSERVGYSQCKSNNTDNWMILQSLIFYFVHFTAFQKNDEVLRSFFRTYNENIASIEDEAADCYRRIYFIAKNGEFDYSFPYAFDRKAKIDLIDEAFIVLAEAAEAMTAEFVSLHGHIRQQTDAIHTLENQLREAYRDVLEAQNAAKRQEQVILTMRASKFWQAREALARIVSFARRR